MQDNKHSFPVNVASFLTGRDCLLRKKQGSPQESYSVKKEGKRAAYFVKKA
jgi:hypothetical protein